MSADAPISLNGRCAIVTGAAAGLGKAYAIALAKRGVNLALADIRDDLADVAAEAEALGVRVGFSHAAVSNPDDVERIVNDARAMLGRIDILVNNAGVWGGSRADDDLDKTLEDYDNIVGTNLKGEFLFGRAVLPIMIAQGDGGDIVNVATDHMVTCGTPYQVCPHLDSCPWGSSPRPTGGGDAMDLYDASKWALNGLTFAWAKAGRAHGIRVNSLCMGATDSLMIRSFHNNAPSPAEVASWMKAEDAAQVLVDLLAEGPNGRTANTLNFCIGRPCRLEPPLQHVYITEADLDAG
jgi:NAD(P)-dependent dehydrogenase (short-subunit alcohol dehydrogenase family)